MSFGPDATLWPILFVVLVAGTGLIVGLRVVDRESGWLRLLVAIPNALVLLFYGFLLLFFGLGGSR